MFRFSFRMGEGETFASSSPYETELVGVFTQLMPDTQEFLLEMARALLQKQKKR